MRLHRKRFYLEATVIFLSLWAFTAQAALTFGQRGRDGWNGQNGLPGQSARDVTLWADRPQSLNLDGTDGEDGEGGRDGENAYSCYQGRPNYDLVGADGGQGGRGGNGGKGGNGANATIYYQDINDLKSLRISSVGGRSGRPGLEGRGGRGCDCTQSSWRIAYMCDANKDGNASETCYRTYFCRSGRDGFSGARGVALPNGNLGAITLIKSAIPLEQVVADRTGTLAEMVSVTQELKKHLWISKSGANSLLGRGSSVANNFYEYTRTAEASFVLRWSAPVDLARFGHAQFRFFLDERGNFNHQLLTPGIHFKTSLVLERGVHTLVIEDAHNVRDLVNFKIESLKGLKSQAKIHLANLAQNNEVGVLSAMLELERESGRDRIVWKGAVPQQYLRLQGENLVIDLGLFGATQYLESSGDLYELDLVITRHLHGREYKFQKKLELRLQR